MKRVILFLVAGATLVACNSDTSWGGDNTNDASSGAAAPQSQSAIYNVEGPADGDIHSAPENIAYAIFEAAVSGDVSKVQGICDPLQEHNDYAAMLCNLSSGSEEGFMEHFKGSEINGPVAIIDGFATIPFLAGPNHSNQEQMKLVNRDGKWYLFAFRENMNQGGPVTPPDPSQIREMPVQ